MGDTANNVHCTTATKMIAMILLKPRHLSSRRLKFINSQFWYAAIMSSRLITPALTDRVTASEDMLYVKR